MPIQIIGLIIGAVAVVLLVAGIVSTVRSRGSVEQRLQTFAGAGEVQVEDKTGSEETLDAHRRQPQSGVGGPQSLGKFVDAAGAGRSEADRRRVPGAAAAGRHGGRRGGLLLVRHNRAWRFWRLVLGWFAPRWFMSYRQGARLRAFNDQLGDALNLMVNGLRSGYSVMQAMEAVSREMPPPHCREFGRVVQEVQIGLSLDQALANMLRRIKSDDLDLVVTAINVQREVGGNLAEILDVISFTIRERVRIKGEIRTLDGAGTLFRLRHQSAADLAWR